MSLLLSEIGHFVITLFLAAYMYFKTRSWMAVAATFLTGFFIDVDHLVDYFYYAGPRFSLKEFLSLHYVHETGKILTPFHAWEYVLLLLWGRRFSQKYATVLLGMAVGLAGHLVWDQISNGASILAYSIIYRILTDFSLAAYLQLPW